MQKKIDFHSMIEISEWNEINKFKYKWRNLIIAFSNYKNLTDNLDHILIP